ncbi:hypothetical protein [Chitinophaga filiformis]|uniref:Outer membrane protein beta-barrel domain-containing protein n=1 Tax=Chitinophaga filiformis TaxID=104663 RepID=A0A1G7I8R2_CHIFI|nr:hypothetical protein [Chitinophaga filiformis]SDF09075.1 hypothetical protein SAMN04488121_101758 [Chitinophaga filiformis]
MRQKYIITLLLTLTIAQASIAQDTKNDNHFEFETDPIAFILKGYSAHLGYQTGHFRWDVGVYGVEVPSFFSGYDNFDIRSNGAGIKLDYLFQKRKGLLVGIESNISRERVSPKSNDDKDLTKRFTNVSLGMRVGYRWMLGSKKNDYKGLYIFPWVSFLSVNLNPQSAIIQGEEYKQKTFSVFPTVHFGYSF